MRLGKQKVTGGSVSSLEFQIEPLTEDHISQALQLCRDAGWNQVRRDWERMIGYEPCGCFAATVAGQPVATVTTTRYGHELAWIGMMLVDRRYRRYGIATTLMQKSIEYLKSHHVGSIKLDATPEGELVYQKMGFEVEWTFHRWARGGEPGEMQIQGNNVSLPRSLLELDQLAFGASRDDYLGRLSNDSLVHVDASGYGMLRPGSNGIYLGPIAATTQSTADRILTRLLQNVDGQVIWDVPTPNAGAVQLAETLGFSPVRELKRMRLGDPPAPIDLNLQFGLADPATG